jgi:mRNA interferase MazF
VRRGEVWTASGGADYAGKPRPVIIVQNDQFPLTQSVTTCSLTTTEVDAGILRVRIEPTEMNGLKALSFVMVDKVTTIPRSKLGRCIGSLSAADLESLSRALAVFLDLAH